MNASNEMLKRIAPTIQVVLCLNKVDRCTKEELDEAKELVERVFPGLPAVSLSALKGQNTTQVLGLAYQHLDGTDEFGGAGVKNTQPTANLSASKYS